jgi:hypothetical protein
MSVLRQWICFHAIFSSKTFSIPYREDSAKNNNHKGSTDDRFYEGFEIVYTNQSECQKKFHDQSTVFQIMIDQHGSNKSGYEFMPPTPVGNFSKLHVSLQFVRMNRAVVEIPRTNYSAYYMGLKFQYVPQCTTIS